MFGKVNKSDKDEFKIGDIVIYENHISKVIRIDLPKYKLLRIRIYHTWVFLEINIRKQPSVQNFVKKYMNQKINIFYFNRLISKALTS